MLCKFLHFLKIRKKLGQKRIYFVAFTEFRIILRLHFSIFQKITFYINLMTFLFTTNQEGRQKKKKKKKSAKISEKSETEKFRSLRVLRSYYCNFTLRPKYC